MNMIWFLNATLCFVRLFVINCFTWGSLGAMSLSAFSISDCKDSEKSKFSREFSGTTG
jgi:hypothetical protein